MLRITAREASVPVSTIVAVGQSGAIQQFIPDDLLAPVEDRLAGDEDIHCYSYRQFFRYLNHLKEAIVGDPGLSIGNG